MADDADRSSQDTELLDEVVISAIRKRAAAIPVGEPGECNHCGETFTRIVRGHCGRCRDLLGKP